MRLRVNHVMSVYEAICTQMKIREIRLSVQWKLIKKALLKLPLFISSPHLIPLLVIGIAPVRRHVVEKQGDKQEYQHSGKDRIKDIPVA